MLNRLSFKDKYPNVTEGTIVRSLDGEKLGKIVLLEEDSFTVEKGFFFPKDFVCRYEDIEDFRDGELYLNQDKASYADWRNESYGGWSQTEDINAGRLNAVPSDSYRDKYGDRYDSWKGAGDLGTTGSQNISSTEQVKVPVAEEELQAQKTMRQTGEVKIRKVVHTEYKHFTVPVTREEVRVERVPATGATTDASTSTSTFKDETISVPVMEEEVTVTKRPVVKEEIRVSKDRHIEEKEISGEVRKEDVEIDKPDRIPKRKAG